MATGASYLAEELRSKKRTERVSLVRSRLHDVCAQWFDEKLNSRYTYTYGSPVILRSGELKLIEKILKGDFGKELDIFITVHVRNSGADKGMKMQDITLEAFRRDGSRKPGTRPMGRPKIH
jgi:hypothetical protein